MIERDIIALSELAFRTITATILAKPVVGIRR